MGTGIRVFFVNEDETLKRIPLTRYEQLLGADPEVRFQEYAGKRVRYALATLEFVSRKPVEIVSIQYSILSFDSLDLCDFFLLFLPCCSDFFLLEVDNKKRGQR